MAEPRRIQRQRTKGWRMPAGAVIVSRPGRWGNPYRVGWYYQWSGFMVDAAAAVEAYRRYVGYREPDTAPLRGHDLACWCALCDAHKDGLPLGVVCPDCAPCHADVLLTLANA